MQTNLILPQQFAHVCMDVTQTALRNWPLRFFFVALITCWRMQKFGQPKVDNLALQIKEPCWPGIQRVPFADAGGEISSLTKKKWCVINLQKQLGDSWTTPGGFHRRKVARSCRSPFGSPFGRGKPCLGSAFPMRTTVT